MMLQNSHQAFTHVTMNIYCYTEECGDFDTGGKAPRLPWNGMRPISCTVGSPHTFASSLPGEIISHCKYRYVESIAKCVTQVMFWQLLAQNCWILVRWMIASSVSVGILRAWYYTCMQHPFYCVEPVERSTDGDQEDAYSPTSTQPESPKELSQSRGSK